MSKEIRFWWKKSLLMYSKAWLDFYMKRFAAALD